MSTKFVPGWKMTAGQKASYFRLLGEVCAAAGLSSSADKEALRRTVHLRAFGRAVSAKEIDHLKGFDAFKAVCLALLHPDDLNAQLRQSVMPRTRLVVACRDLADEGYIVAICKDRFGTADWTELGEDRLVQLRNTLAARKPARAGAAAEEQDGGCEPVGTADKTGGEMPF